MKEAMLPIECPCEDEPTVVVINAANEARLRCLGCGDEGMPTNVAPPADTLR